MALRKYILDHDEGQIDFDSLELFCRSSGNNNAYIVFRNSIRVISLKHWFAYIQDLNENSSYISALYWISEIIKGKCVRLAGVEPPFRMTGPMEEYITGIMKIFIEQGLRQENVSFMLEISVEILIKMKKFDFLFNEFLIKLRHKSEEAQQARLVRVFLRYLASFIGQVGLENLPEYFFGLIFTFDEDRVIPRFLYYLCGHFDITKKLSYFFPVLINRQLDEHLMYISLNSSADNLEMVLEAWLARLEVSEDARGLKQTRVRFILSFVYDIMFEKEYRRLDEVRRDVLGLSREDSQKTRRSLDLGITRMLLTWLFEPKNFLRLVCFCAKETLTLYNLVLLRFRESASTQAFFALGEMVQGASAGRAGANHRGQRQLRGRVQGAPDADSGRERVLREHAPGAEQVLLGGALFEPVRGAPLAAHSGQDPLAARQGLEAVHVGAA